MRYVKVELISGANYILHEDELANLKNNVEVPVGRIDSYRSPCEDEPIYIKDIAICGFFLSTPEDRAKYDEFQKAICDEEERRW